MAIKHKATMTTLQKGLSADWNDNHIQDYATSIDLNMLLMDTPLTTCWDLFSAGTGNDPAVSLVGAAGSGHSFVEFSTGATTNNTSGMSRELAGTPGNITSPDDLPILTFSMQIDTVHTAGNVLEMGLLDQGTAPFTANQDGAYFRVLDNKIYAVTGTGAAETTTDLGDFSEYAHYRIEVLSASVRFFIDDMVNAAATHAANLPDSDLTIMLTIRSLNNVDSTARMDGCSLQVLRKL